MSLSCSLPIFDKLFSRKCSYMSKITRLILGSFCHGIQQNINENTVHFYHANLENFVHNMVVSIVHPPIL